MFFRKKEVHIPNEDCELPHVVAATKFKLITLSGMASIDQISSFLKQKKSKKWGFGFYVVSKCVHKHPHNNRFRFKYLDDDMVELELNRPADICFCFNYIKNIKINETAVALSDLEGIINNPEKNGFKKHEW